MGVVRVLSILLLGAACGLSHGAVLRGTAKEAVAIEYAEEKLSGLVQKAELEIEESSLREREGGVSPFGHMFFEFIFAIIYYFLIVKNYPKLDLEPTEEAKELQKLDAISATLQTSVPNCVFSVCCWGPRAAHTFHSAGLLEYWAGCALMNCFPCCTLYIMNSFTPLNEKLGGEKKDFCTGLLCAFCCWCCVIAQDAESLDLITRQKTGFCGVEPMEK